MIRSFFARDDVQHWLVRAGVVALVAYLVTVGLLAIDFGYHYDEWYHLLGVKHCISSLSWMPQRYVYNGLYFLMGLPALAKAALPVLPALLKAALDHREHAVDLGDDPAVKEAQRVLLAYVDTNGYVLAVRATFLCASALAIVWVYLTIRTLRPRPRGAALAGAAFVALSWEVQYHARFLAVDAVVMQFLALELFAVVRGWRAAGPSARRWAALAGAAAAGAWAGKTIDIFAVIPAAALAFRPGVAGRERARTALTAAACWLIVAFVTSPGAFVDPFRYIAAMAVEKHNYNDMTLDYPYYVEHGEHVRRAALWLVAAVPSHFLPLAVSFSAIALLGWITIGRRHGAILLWTGYLVLYEGFVATNKLLVVRNHLPLVPLAATMFGLGVAWLCDAAPALSRRGAAAVIALILAGFCANAAWSLQAALRVRHETAETVLARFRRDREADRGRFRLSPRLAGQLGPAWTAAAGCRPVAPNASGADGADGIYLFYDENYWNRWSCNRLRVFDAFYGADELNYDWNVSFPGRLGKDRIVGLSPARAAAIHLDVARYLDCAR
jgi:hypothetical protein